ncbi:MAG: MATE family efflux transporter [Erysipelotrichaceae bacterium]|nr:MATE family efflux transporter [Erysipelotrichaceae bacterium]MBQ4252397.1 MATE family efflux transporter [Erysipelotrichaceae bacterium]
MNKQQNVNLTEGNITRQLLRFVWPVIVSSIFQQLYGIVNSLIVGNFVSSQALSAVSASNSITMLPFFFFGGMSLAAGILVSRCYGSGDYHKLQDVVKSGLLVAFFGGIILTGIMEIFLVPLMNFSNIRESLFADSLLYLRIYLGGSVAVFLYEMLFHMMRALGDSQHPLQYMIISTVTNTVLGIFFVRVMNWGVGGVALATILSQTLAIVLGIITLKKFRELREMSFHNIHVDPELLGNLLALGIPTALQNMALSFGNLLVQSKINLFPDAVISGMDLANKVGFWAQIPMMALSNVGTSFVGQNLGAGKLERVREGIRVCLYMGLAITFVLSTAMFIAAPLFVSLFDNTPAVVTVGTSVVRHTVYSYLPLTFSHVYNGACRGAGNVKAPTIIAVCAQSIFKYAFVAIGLYFWFDVQVIYLSSAAAFTMAGLLATLYFKLSPWTRGTGLRI